MKVAIGADHGGYRLKEDIKGLLEDLGVDYKDFGTHSTESVDYPDVALPVAQSVGIGIAANKVKGIRAALVHDTFSAHACREHNDANILTMGERVIGPGLARDIVTIWLATDFEGGRHERRVEKIKTIEK